VPLTQLHQNMVIWWILPPCQPVTKQLIDYLASQFFNLVAVNGERTQTATLWSVLRTDSYPRVKSNMTKGKKGTQIVSWFPYWLPEVKLQRQALWIAAVITNQSTEFYLCLM
jgi:hypothetical protein